MTCRDCEAVLPPPGDSLTLAALMSSSARHSAMVLMLRKAASRAPVHSSQMAWEEGGGKGRKKGDIRDTLTRRGVPTAQGFHKRGHLVDAAQRGHIHGLPPHRAGAADARRVLAGAAVDDGVHQDLQGVLRGGKKKKKGIKINPYAPKTQPLRP